MSTPLPVAPSLLRLVLASALAVAAVAQEVIPTCDRVDADLAAASAAIDRGDIAAARAAAAHALESARAARCADRFEPVGRVAFAAGDIATSGAAWRERLAALESAPAVDAVAVAIARANLATTLVRSGELESAEADARQAIEVLAGVASAAGEHQNARATLASILAARGDLDGARALLADIVEQIEKRAGSDPDEIVTHKLTLATYLHVAGDLRGALELEEACVERLAHRYPAEHPRLLAAQQNLASTLYALQETARAAEIHERILAARERSLPADDPDLQVSRLSVAAGAVAQGDLSRARALTEQALAGLAARPAADPTIANQGRANLAAILYMQGDYAAGIQVQNHVLDAQVAQFGAAHPNALSARRQLASMLVYSGDLAVGHVMCERAAEETATQYGPDHPETLIARATLAICRQRLGDHAGSRASNAEVLAARERIGGDDPLARSMRAGSHLALAINELDLGNPAEARAQLTTGLGELSGIEAANANLSVELRVALAVAECGSGAEAEGRERLAQVLAEVAATRPAGGADLVRIRRNWAWAVPRGDRDALGRALLDLAREVRAATRTLEGASPSDAWARLSVLEPSLPTLFSLAPLVDGASPLHEEIFAAVEELRAAADLCLGEHAPPAAGAARELADRSNELRARIRDVVAARSMGGTADTSLLADLVRQRDAVDAEIARTTRLRVVHAPTIDPAAFRASLAADEVAVLYRETSVYPSDARMGAMPSPTRELVCHVVSRDGVRRIDLGPARAITTLVGAWRAAIEREGERGLANDTEDDTERACGRALRARVLDPALAAVPGARRILVRADGPLHFVPFDALPLDGRPERVQDEVDVVVVTSLARRTASASSRDGAASLLTVGGVDYNAAVSVAPGARVLGAAPALDRDADSASTRAGPLGLNWRPLPGTAAEAAAVADLFRGRFERSAVVLERAAVTKDAFVALAEGARYLHVATHGYFAADPARGSGGTSVESEAFDRAVRGIAPSALCGLALAGANRGMDEYGRVPGIVTAEEIAGLDLSGCALAVLSACDTSIGIERPGLDPTSLRTAFHVAGARVVIASLWKVPDGVTADFFGDFYTRLWVEGLEPAAALRATKLAAARDGQSPRAWAAWVLTGDSR